MNSNELRFELEGLDWRMQGDRIPLTRQDKIESKGCHIFGCEADKDGDDTCMWCELKIGE